MIFVYPNPLAVSVTVQGDGVYYVPGILKVTLPKTLEVLPNLTPESPVAGSELAVTVPGSRATYETYTDRSVAGTLLTATIPAAASISGDMATGWMYSPDEIPPAVLPPTPPAFDQVTGVLVSRVSTWPDIATGPAHNLVTGTLKTRQYAYPATTGNTITLPPDGVARVQGVATVGVSASGSGVHAIGGPGLANVPVSAEGVIEVSSTSPTAYGYIHIPVTAAGNLAQAVRGSGAVALPLTIGVDAHAIYAIGGPGAANVTVSAQGTLNHGVSAHDASTVKVQASGTGEHVRYEVRGEVRLTEGGLLVSRRVRVYARLTGQLVGQADTVGGKFAVHCGLTPGEYVIVPIDLDPAAVDFTPPGTSRVVSVLAQDAA